MTKWLVRGSVALVLLIACLSTTGEASDPSEEPSAPEVVLDIGTGSPTGVYFPAGQAICLVMEIGTSSGLTCRALNTGGSAYNLDNVSSGGLQLGIAQADTLYRAWHGEAPFKAKGRKLRVLFSLHEEMVTLAVHQDAEIISFKRIQGKRLNVGPEGSGNERVVSELFKSCSIFPGDLGLMGRLKTAAVPQALLTHTMDGYFYVVGHPNISLAQTANSMPLKMIPLDGRCVNTLVRSKPYFDTTVIPGGLYRGVDQDTPTFGVKAWVVSSEDVPESVIYSVVQQVFDNLEEFRKQNPAFYRLSPRKMLKPFEIPYHQGALKYYRQQGWYDE